MNIIINVISNYNKYKIVINILLFFCQQEIFQIVWNWSLKPPENQFFISENSFELKSFLQVTYC